MAEPADHPIQTEGPGDIAGGRWSRPGFHLNLISSSRSCPGSRELGLRDGSGFLSSQGRVCSFL